MFKNVFIFQHIMVGGPLKLLVKITFRQKNNVIYSYLDRIMVPANQHLFSLVNTFKWHNQILFISDGFNIRLDTGYHVS
jgi:hypothetical protein